MKAGAHTTERATGAVPADRAVDVRDLVIQGPTGPLAARLYRASGASTVLADALLVFFHAGGFVSGDLDEADPCMRDLARHLDGVILASTYAQAPNQPFPAAAEDAYAVIVEATAHPKRYQWTGRSLVVGGVEAGGNLAAVAAMMARDRGGPPVAGQMLITPMLDPGLSSSSMRCASEKPTGEQIASKCADGYRDYLPRAADRFHPYACPLASTRLKGLPPTLVVSIEGDPLHDEASAYRDKLVAAGVPVRTTNLGMPTDTLALADANARCHASSDGVAFHAMADFVSSVSRRDA